jgi:hypothetical protein
VVTAAEALPPTPCGHPRLRVAPDRMCRRNSNGGVKDAQTARTIATALAIIGVLAMTALADDAGALGLGYRRPPSVRPGPVVLVAPSGTLGTFGVWHPPSASL